MFAISCWSFFMPFMYIDIIYVGRPPEVARYEGLKPIENIWLGLFTVTAFAKYCLLLSLRVL